MTLSPQATLSLLGPLNQSPFSDGHVEDMVQEDSVLAMGAGGAQRPVLKDCPTTGILGNEGR